MDQLEPRSVGFVFKLLSPLDRIYQQSPLLDEAFGVPRGGSYLDDFPIWGGDLQDAAHLGYFARDVLVACCSVRSAAVRPLRSKNPDDSERIAVIGAVATHPAFRNNGLASGLVAEALGLSALVYASFYDDELAAELNIDGVTETFATTILIGPRKPKAAK